MPTPKSDHATKTAALALAAAKSAAKAASDAACVATAQGEIIARLDERQKASSDSLNEFRGEWRENAKATHEELKEIKKVAECHEHKDLATGIKDLTLIASNGDKMARVIAAIGGLIGLGALILGFFGK